MFQEKPELDDIQGLVMSGFKQLPYAFYLLLHINDGVAARRWLEQVLKDVTHSDHERGKPEHYALNIAFTYSGMKAIGLEEAALRTFSTPFIEGMSDYLRARLLRDEPGDWLWGNNTGRSEDILLLVFARTPEQLEQQRHTLLAMCVLGGLTVLRVLETTRQTEFEHFGFRDGISQPVMSGTKRGKGKKATNRPGEFLLGYSDDYGYANYDPLVSQQSDPMGLLRAPKKRDIKRGASADKRMLGFNGTYLVFRQIEQRVAQFWNFARAAAVTNNESTERFAAKLIGRWRSGAPLVTCSDADDPGLVEGNKFKDLNIFNYLKDDPHGLRCPVGAHIRRANPRDSLGPQKSFALRSANHHRMLRRGRAYGPRATDKFNDDGENRGLFFICINSDIERQFEFVQQSWINNTVFGGLYCEVDPITHIGHDRVLTLPTDPLRRQVNRLEKQEPFVKVRGGGYFFLPGIRALKYLAALQ
jgi:Dyp-type peroxidase family